MCPLPPVPRAAAACGRRDHGPRGDRQQTRLMWLVEAIGVERFRQLLSEAMGGGPEAQLAPPVHVRRALECCS
jgi:sulfite reductase beta subunit-like hemoprotein